LAENSQKFTEELEQTKNKYVNELEEKKIFALELDRRKQELGQQLTVEKMEIDRRLGRVAQAEETANSFQYLISRIRFGEKAYVRGSGASKCCVQNRNAEVRSFRL
jgi:hypothetical protein